MKQHIRLISETFHPRMEQMHMVLEELLKANLKVNISKRLQAKYILARIFRQI
jgi:hypothetical protein